MILVVAAYFLYSYRDMLWERLQPFVTKQDEAVTELYFTDYESLLKKLNVNTKYGIDFTIVNHEGKREVYEYQATVTENTDSRKLPLHTIELDDGQSAQLQIQFIPHQMYAREKVTIALPAKGQSIEYSAMT